MRNDGMDEKDEKDEKGHAWTRLLQSEHSLRGRTSRVNRRLEEEGSDTAGLGLLLHEDLEVLVDDGDSQQDARPRPDGAQQVRHHTQCADAKPPERSRRRDVSVQLVHQRVVPMARHVHLLLLQLLRHLP